MSSSRIPLYYTFGNHMHWVDMEWLWGYHVLPGSVRDMLKFCEEAGVKGNVNFDGIGYEKMAAEAPDELALLKDAVQRGDIEPVGCSYGQPYGLFHGGESNVRQRIYGVRAVTKLLGKRPTTFWEEEFDFFPQLPQMLRGVGFKYSSLFFQWTWHTPEIPKEDEPVVWWEGQDGSRLLCATRNRLNLHQWPEDMDILFNDLAAEAGEKTPQQADGGSKRVPLILQWLELMPSPDWMCRSELLLPKMKELLGDARFEIRAATLPEYLTQFEGEDLPVRNYSMDEVWHGMSLGKNNDYMRRESRAIEARLYKTESMHAVAGLWGRPYTQWDVYPIWELEEAWRQLLQAQHHDNDECEGLCGHMGKTAYRMSHKLVTDCYLRCQKMIERVDAPAGEQIYFNPLPWEINTEVDSHTDRVGVLPPMSFSPALNIQQLDLPKWDLSDGQYRFEYDGFLASVNADTACITELGNTHHSVECCFGKLKLNFNGREVRAKVKSVINLPSALHFVLAIDDAIEIRQSINFLPSKGCFSLSILGIDMPQPAPGFKGATRLSFSGLPEGKVLTDQPYGFTEVKTGSSGLKKYPQGDWMTSPQWFEEVSGAFSSLTSVDFSDDQGAGVFVVHTGAQQWFLTPEGYENVLTLYDPWDEDYFESTVKARYFIYPHDSSLSNGQRFRHLREVDVNPLSWTKTQPGGDIPPGFSALSCRTANVNITAFYRETEDQGAKLSNYAGKGIGYPYIIRLVEFDGLSSEVEVDLAGTVAKAYKTNLLGEIEHEIVASVSEKRSLLKFPMRPYEIATLYVDIVEGRKQPRNLDAHRNVWATVHRLEGGT